MDVEKLEAALTPKTRMVLAVSILGNPAKLDVIRDFCDRHDLLFMEDNCESLDATLPDGRKTGTLGDLSTFSFFFSHHISTMEGGMVVTDDDELFHLLLSLRAHGWTRDLPDDSPLFERTSDDLFEAYRFILPGYNLRPLEFSGAVGQAQLAKLDAMTETRRRNWRLFQDLFGSDPRFIIQKEYGKSSAFAFTLILSPKIMVDRRCIFDRLQEAGIGFRIITGGCFLAHDVISHYDHSEVGSIENAFIAHRRGFFVGNHPSDLRPQIEHLHQVLNDLG
jgi:CDP-6-deoxy-D-xylo-4-hexulose-3-dehydrase